MKVKIPTMQNSPIFSFDYHTNTNAEFLSKLIHVEKNIKIDIWKFRNCN